MFHTENFRPSLPSLPVTDSFFSCFLAEILKNGDAFNPNPSLQDPRRLSAGSETASSSAALQLCSSASSPTLTWMSRSGRLSVILWRLILLLMEINGPGRISPVPMWRKLVSGVHPGERMLPRERAREKLQGAGDLLNGWTRSSSQKLKSLILIAPQRT